ncbi:hypothetical protein SAMN05444287_2832 [Octadecabacter temperatus]|uniref:Uncharacterized protein n=2 Tax=Octadecabacter temperatus TaxID=1458307 RepID=A0A0K0Y975_9RHOB|nr:hypothetical protein OSB_29980 [Octadecabacter temperatus]SIO41823.1 hypothetical protein SAMN05444287_2832 [Octadecabacter temperatus]
MRTLLATLCPLALTACMSVDMSAVRTAVENVNLLDETRRDIDVAYRDLPFDTGRVYVVANEHGDLHTYSLTPCRNGTHICGGTGRVGHVERTLDYFVVTGAYRDRTFYLSPGGDGYLTWRGVNRDLAWN